MNYFDTFQEDEAISLTVVTGNTLNPKKKEVVINFNKPNQDNSFFLTGINSGEVEKLSDKLESIDELDDHNPVDGFKNIAVVDCS